MENEKKYSGLKSVSNFCRFFGAVLLFCCVISGFFLSDGNPLFLCTYIAAGVVAFVFLYAISGVLNLLMDIEQNTRKVEEQSRG